MKSIRTTLLFLALIFCGYNSISQVTYASNVSLSASETDPAFETKTTYPEFVGGHEALQKFLQDNLVYPEPGIRKGHEGTVVVEFFVNVDGSIEDIAIRNSVCKRLDTTAMKLVKKMPNWKPAEFNGRTVRARYLLPITFELTL